MKNTGIIKRIKRINEALPMLLLGILGYGLIVFGIGIIFAPDRLKFATGLLIGLALAVFMAFNMAFTIDEAVSSGSEKAAKAKGISGSVFRYAILFIVLAGMAYFEFGDVIAAFLGVLGLKISAYIQPFAARLKRG